MQHQRPLLFLAPLAVAGCLERDIASAEAYLSASSSEPASSSGTGSSTTTGPPVSTVTSRDSTEGGSSTSPDGDDEDEDDTTADVDPTTTTDDPPAACGDAIVQPGEECDDPTDLSEETCTATCLRPRLAFLTSERFTGADIDGLAGLHQLIADVISEQQWRYAEHRPVPHIAAAETATAAKRLTWLATHLDSIATDRTEP